MRRLLTITFILLMAVGVVQAQDDSGSTSTVDTVLTSTVDAVLFYLPTCPHCHDVMDNHLPPLQAEYGDQLRIFYIDASEGNNASIMGATCTAVGVPYDRCGSVPLLVIGDEWMLGSADIPARAPGIIADGVENGGIHLPDVESLQTYLAPELAASAQQAAPVIDNRSIIDKLAEDPIGSGVALVVLILLLGSLGTVTLAVYKQNPHLKQWQQIGIAIGMIFAIGMSLSIVLGGGDDTTPILLALTVGFLLVGAGWLYTTDDMRTIAIPVITVAGIIVAFYLATVETSDTAAVCGIIGDCGAVQTSAYAHLFGILPVGVLGVVGFFAIVITWGARQFIQNIWLDAALVGMVIFGAVFSIYLTFLEPFVIGATCAWCITSALIMLTLLWMIVPTHLQRLINSREIMFRRA